MFTNTTMRRTFVIALCMMVAVCIAGLVPGNAAFAKAKKMKMPVQVKEYNKNNGKWEYDRTVKFTYNKKGDLVKAETIFKDNDRNTTVIKYTYKKGKKTAAVATTPDSNMKFRFDKKGRVVYWDEKGGLMDATRQIRYGKKNTIKSVNWVDDNPENERLRGTNTYTTTNKGKKVVASGMSTSDEKCTLTRIYDKKGLLKSKKGHLVYWSYDNDYSYKMKKGLVTEKTFGDTKLVFSYGKTKAKKAEYLNFINLDERSAVKYVLYQ